MIRSTASKVMWVGRATVFLVGLSVILALIFGVATTALGVNGNPLLLGKRNVASAISTLIKQGPGPALKLQVGAGQPPLAVNSRARVANLNAARAGRADSAASAGFATNAQNAANAGTLDSLDSSQFLGGTIIVRRTDVAVPDGQTVSEFAACATGERIIGGSANLDAVTADSLVNVSRPSKDNAGVGAVPGDGEAFSFWKGTATNAAGDDTATRTMRVFAICAR